VLRNAFRRPDGSHRDTVVFSIIDSEWPTVRTHLDFPAQSRPEPAVKRYQLGLVGARGYVGSEFIKLIAGHPDFELNFVASREREGQFLSEHEPVPDRACATATRPWPKAAALGVDALVLALPNGKAGDFVAAVDEVAPDTVVLDLSADYRFDKDWYYGLPELTRSRAAGREAHLQPGLLRHRHATGAGAAVRRDRRARRNASASPAIPAPAPARRTRTTRKAARQPHPYSLIDHIHEREVTRQLGQPVEFTPAVGAAFPRHHHDRERAPVEALAAHAGARPVPPPLR
jgi:N-acetyl-gamma-glutamyl-phosphate reductase